MSAPVFWSILNGVMSLVPLFVTYAASTEGTTRIDDGRIPVATAGPSGLSADDGADTNAPLGHLVAAIGTLEAELEAVRKERDAALAAVRPGASGQ